MQFLDQSVRDFLTAAASPRPVPGGGSVAALVAALAASMAEMAANFTVGKKKFAAVQVEIQDLRDKVAALRGRLGKLMDDDARAFTELQMVQHQPKGSAEEVAAWQAKVDAASAAAAAVPSTVADACVELLTLARRIAEICNPKLLADVGVCAHLARGALEAAHLNVVVNLRGSMDVDVQIEQDNRVEARRALAGEILTAITDLLDTRGATGSPAETGMFEVPRDTA